jgi:hypothetical protein
MSEFCAAHDDDFFAVITRTNRHRYGLPAQPCTCALMGTCPECQVAGAHYPLCSRRATEREEVMTDDKIVDLLGALQRSVDAAKRDRLARRPDPPRLRPKPVPSGEPAQPEGRIEDE